MDAIITFAGFSAIAILFVVIAVKLNASHTTVDYVCLVVLVMLPVIALHDVAGQDYVNQRIKERMADGEDYITARNNAKAENYGNRPVYPGTSPSDPKVNNWGITDAWERYQKNRQATADTKEFRKELLKHAEKVRNQGQLSKKQMQENRKIAQLRMEKAMQEARERLGLTAKERGR